MVAHVAGDILTKLEVPSAVDNVRDVRAGICRRIVLIPCADDPEVVVVVETVIMGQKHARNREHPETELVSLKDRSSTAPGATLVTETELRLDDESLRAPPAAA